MTYAARIVADSISAVGVRLTTLEVTFPRIVLAEFNTHRMFSRNSASSRAIPVKTLIQRVLENPYIPSEWGKNQRGMQAEEALSAAQVEEAKDLWLRARDAAVDHAQVLLEVGLHKQLTNRLLEPFMWHTCLVTSTEWSNFFNLRCHPHAHPDIRIPAEMMRDVMRSSSPRTLGPDEWHVPLFGGIDDEPPDRKHDDPFDWTWACKVSVGRCARVSYLTHDGKRDPTKDVELHDKLLTNGHMSPFEHVARPLEEEDYQDPSIPLMVDVGSKTHAPEIEETWCGNFRGWVQYRKTIPHESDLLGHVNG